MPETSGLSGGVAVLLEMDPVLPWGFVEDHVDIKIRGHVASPAAIVEVRLEHQQRILGTAHYGQPNRATVVAMPDGAAARQRGFQFNLLLPATEPRSRHDLHLIACTDDDLECHEVFELELDLNEALAAQVSRGSASGLLDPTAAPPDVILYVERAVIDANGVLLVEGWAIARARLLAVQIHADDHRVGSARLGLLREDVAAAYPAYPNSLYSGFSLTAELEPDLAAVESVRVHAVCLQGFGQDEVVPVQHLVPSRTILPPGLPVSPSGDGTAAALPAPQEEASAATPDPAVTGDVPPSAPPGSAAPDFETRMYCDDVRLSAEGRLSINGWTFSPTGIAQVRVQLDGGDVGLATFGYERADVGALFADSPAALFSGFKFDAPVGDQAQGEHTIRVVVRTAGGGESDTVVIVRVAAAAVPERAAEPAPAEMVPMPEQAAEFKFELDAPSLSHGHAVETVTGRLTIDGWLLCRSGVASFEVFLDEQRLGEVHHGLARQDVGAAFPDWPNAVRAGYAFHCPPRSLRDGEHTIRLAVRANSGATIERSFAISVAKTADQQDRLGVRRGMPRVEADLGLALLDELDFHPSFRFVLRQGLLPDLAALGQTLEGLRRQAYPGWTVLVLAGDAAVARLVSDIIAAVMPDKAEQFSVLNPFDRGWAEPLADAMNGRDLLFGPLLAGDELGADALLELALAAARDRQAGLIYGDELRLSPVSHEAEPFFKPDYSPDLLSATNYIGRPWVATAAVLAEAGVTPAGLWQQGEYDTVLRCAALSGAVRHVAKLLCRRGPAVLDDADQEKAALQRFLVRSGQAGEVLETPIPGTWRVRRQLASAGKVSIIIPTCAANGYIETCIRTLRERTRYRDFEIVVIDNIPSAEAGWKDYVARNADKVVDIPAAFNWSFFNNRAAEAASGDYLLFLNDDIEIIDGDWLDALLEHAQRPEVGIVGPQLLYRDGTVQHAGMFLANNGIGRHAFRFAAKDDPCYFGLALTQRNVMALTGACMLMRREVFDRLGGFEEAHEIVNNDLDFALRVHKAGLLSVYTPYASLIHYELASRAYLKDVFDLGHFNAAWKTVFAAGDPYFNPNLWRHADDYRQDDEAVQWVVSGAPVFHKREIQRILVVKLDHIGDFVTALPPIRRLKSIFPHARLTVLAGKASRAFVPLEPAIDELITFDFFHARSQLGERAVTEADYAALAETLRPYRFDLAVDLRKHPSTRDVLKHTGARFLAGFDYLGQYPNLDIALDWDGDRTLQRKRAHIIDDLLALVGAIERATEADRDVLATAPTPTPLAVLPPAVRALFDKPVVAIHPGAGNVTKQWPEEHFSALIDLMIERNDVNVMLVGGPDEQDIAQRLQEGVLHADRVVSMAGATKLSELPHLLAHCALYVGNDSGPKHIAAATGIPTIGVHSGVVDPVEWGPMGPRAVALRRNMTCSPCYLANAEDCPRALACLKFLEPGTVYEAVDRLLSAANPARSQSSGRSMCAGNKRSAAVAPAAAGALA